MSNNIGYIKEALNWALNSNTVTNLKTTSSPSKLKTENINEKETAHKIIKDSEWSAKKMTSQWTTCLGENLVKEVFQKFHNTETWRPKKLNGFKPDLETESFIIEVKTRNWTTPGTAGEKVLGTPYKYSRVPKLYKKPLLIILLGFQEYECSSGKLNVFEPKCEIQKEILNLYNRHHIYYIKFSDLIVNPEILKSYKHKIN